jgi:hypothetical protein
VKYRTRSSKLVPLGRTNEISVSSREVLRGLSVLFLTRTDPVSWKRCHHRLAVDSETFRKSEISAKFATIISTPIPTSFKTQLGMCDYAGD